VVFNAAKGMYPSLMLVVRFISVSGVLAWANDPSTNVQGHVMVSHRNLRKLSENTIVFWENKDELRTIVSKCTGIATLYGLIGLEFEPRWGREFPHPSRPPLDSILRYNGYRFLPGCGLGRPLRTSTEVTKKKRAMPLHTPPSVPSLHVID
jgi:hypothetical protein